MVDLEIIPHKMCLIRCHQTIANIILGRRGVSLLTASQIKKIYQNVIKKSEVTFRSRHQEENSGQIPCFSPNNDWLVNLQFYLKSPGLLVI